MYAAVLITDFELQCASRAEAEPSSLPTVLVGEAAGSSVPIIQQANAGAQGAGVVAGDTPPGNPW